MEKTLVAESHQVLHGRTSEMKVLESGYKSNGRNIQSACRDIEKAIEIYIDIFRYMSEKVIMDGRVHEILVAYVSEFEKIKGQVIQIGNDYKTLCSNFPREIEIEDDFVYDKTNKVRDFSDRFMYQILQCISDVTPPGGSKLMDRICDTLEYRFHSIWKFFDKSHEHTASYIGALTEYKGKSKKRIKEIFANVHCLDETYQKKFNDISVRLNNVIIFLDAANELVSSGSGLSVSGITNKLSRIGQTVLTYTPVERINSQSQSGRESIVDLAKNGFIFSGIFDKYDEYKKIINGDGDAIEKKDAAIKWLSTLRKDSSTFKDYYEWLKGEGEIDWPEPIKSGSDFIKAIDMSNKIVSGTLNFAQGIYNGDVSLMSGGGKDIISATFSAFKGTFKSTFKTPGQTTGTFAGLIVDYGQNMVTNWLDSIQTNTEVSEVYWDTFATSALDIYQDTVCNTPTLAVAYIPANIVSSAVGFDLQGAYEQVSDKKGFAAVTDTFSQMGDLIKENSNWSTWKSGMGVIWDGITGLFK